MVSAMLMPESATLAERSLPTGCASGAERVMSHWYCCWMPGRKRRMRCCRCRMISGSRDGCFITATVARHESAADCSGQPAQLCSAALSEAGRADGVRRQTHGALGCAQYAAARDGDAALAAGIAHYERYRAGARKCSAGDAGAADAAQCDDGCSRGQYAAAGWRTPCADALRRPGSLRVIDALLACRPALSATQSALSATQSELRRGLAGCCGSAVVS
ncbi:hypothetical protein COLO4_02112 [Corchorus olitorius]|uniref:Uncharacterized protein n=1 Tax=Corchorus olitorius TaxID=93759 RepID=A0A1R3L1G1_9ROSI|nr:hypothetical protein COLO4_02112 [Corchorus olitorius]